MMTEKSCMIFQVLDDNHVLANAVSDETYGWYYGMVVLIVGDEDSHFYCESSL